MLQRKKTSPQTKLFAPGNASAWVVWLQHFGAPSMVLPVPFPHQPACSPPWTVEGRRCSEGPAAGGRNPNYLDSHTPHLEAGPAPRLPPSVSMNLNQRLIQGAHPAGPLIGLPTGGCGKPGTATQPWECGPRESTPGKSKRNCPPLHGRGLPRINRLRRRMGPHPSRREPLSHCKSTAACRPNAPFSSSLEGWDAQPDGRKTPARNPTTPSKAEGPMPKEMGKRQCRNARLVSRPKTPQLLRSPWARRREEMGKRPGT
jgi:hypothetical protein